MIHYFDKQYLECYNFIKDSIVKKDKIKLSSGVNSKIYFDIKECLIKDSSFSRSLMFLIKAKLEDNKIGYDTVAGVELGGALISTKYVNIYSKVNNNLVNELILRKSQKTHGNMSCVIGDLNKAKDVIVIEDVITTGESVITAIDPLLINENINIKSIISVIDRSYKFYKDVDDGWFKKWCVKRNINYLSLYKEAQFNER